MPERSQNQPYLLPITQLTYMTTDGVERQKVMEKRGCHGRHDSSRMGRAKFRFGQFATPAANAATGGVGGGNRHDAGEIVQPGFRLERSASLLQPLRSGSCHLANDSGTALGAHASSDGPARTGPD